MAEKRDPQALPSDAGPATPTNPLSSEDLGITPEAAERIRAAEAATRAALEAEPKVTVTCPMGVTVEPAGLYVAVNSVGWRLPAGVPVEVPQSIADLANARIAAALR